jgi:peptidyl-prolyl cis-trans isomerase A (cyclophilin A)
MAGLNSGGRVDGWTGGPAAAVRRLGHSTAARHVPGLVFAALFLAVGCKEKAPAPDTTANKPAGPAAAPPPAPTADTAKAIAPDSFRVAFETTRGTFVVQINRTWAPLGADRFYQLIDKHFFDGARFFRVVPGFVAQFGLAADPSNNAAWDARITDDPVKEKNLRGTLTFATQGPNTRTHQLFLNLADNLPLDGQGFAPMGKVVDGMKVVDSLYSGYGEDPVQQFIQAQGESYLKRTFPKLDQIKTARVVPTK